MELSLIPRDRAILQKGLELLVKACDDVQKKTEAIGLPAVAVVTLKDKTESLISRVDEHLERDGHLEGDYDFPHEEIQVARVGVSLFLGKISKVESAQEELSVPTVDTESRAADARDLADRLAGQTTMALAGR
jgi:hypothetical protein